MKKFDTLYEQLLLLSLFFVIVEIALHMPMITIITPYKITLGLLGLLIVGKMIVGGKSFIHHFFSSIGKALKPIRLAIIPTFLYLAFDVISLFYTKDIPFALTKYVTILSMLAILLCTAYYLVGVHGDVPVRKKVQRILLTIGVTAIATAVYAYVYHTIFHQTFYARRLSMIEDYNQFSIVVIFSYFILLLFLRREYRPKKIYYFWLVLCSALSISAVTLSGSRRSYLMMLACLFIPVIYECISYFQEKNKRGFVRFLASIVLIVGIYSGITFMYNKTTTERYEALTEENEDIINIIGAKPVEEILTDEQALGKREVIWGLAIDAYKNLPTLNKIIGGGGSYASDLYDTPHTKPIIEKMYWKELPDQYMNPHNFILVDLLTGGIVKTVLTLATILGALICLLRNRKEQHAELVYIFIAAAIALGNIFVSSKYGLFNDKFVWTVLILVMAFSVERLCTATLDNKK